MTKQKKKFGPKVVLFLILCLGIVVAFYYFLHSSVFTIEKISLKGNNAVPSNEIIALAGINLGNNIFEFKTEASEKAILIVPRIKTAEVKRSLPNQVVITVVERIPWATVINQKTIFIIDDEGVYLKRMKNLSDTSLPVISMVGLSAKLKPGQRVNDKAVKSVKSFVDVLPKELASEVSEYHYTNNGEVIVFTIQGTEIRLGGTERLQEKIDLWRRVMEMQAEKGVKDRLEYIDLRYEGQPVIQEKL